MSSSASPCPGCRTSRCRRSRQVVAEDELLLDLRAQGIEAADGGVVRRPRRHDRPADEPVLDDAMKVPCGAFCDRDVARERPERQGALDQEERFDRPRQVGLASAGPATAAEATMQPKLCPIKWKLARGATICRRASSSCAPFSPNARARSFIFQNESWRSGERRGPSTSRRCRAASSPAAARRRPPCSGR